MKKIVKIEKPEHHRYAVFLYSQARQSTLLKGREALEVRRAYRALSAISEAWIEESEPAPGQILWKMRAGELPPVSLPADEHKVVTELVEHALKDQEQPLVVAPAFFDALDWWTAAITEE
jgi:hypothetical protein